MAGSSTQYTFDSGGSKGVGFTKGSRKHRHGKHQRTNSRDDPDPTDGSGSLTYSAASSINSAGESTDSSFADIMRVLDLQDHHNGANYSSEIADLIKKKEQLHNHNHYPQGHPKSSSRSIGASVASSLQYSVGSDSQSHMLAGADLISTITGQPSDSYAYDGGNIGGGHLENISNSKNMNNSKSSFGEQNIMFAPAEPAESIKRRKQMKRKSNSSKERDSTNSSSASGSGPRSKHRHSDPHHVPHHHHSSGNSASGGSHRSKSSSKSPSMTGSENYRHNSGYVTPSPQHGKSRSRSSGTKSAMNSSSNSTPPPIPIPFHTSEDDDICYAQWWMSCFPDAFKNLMPKR